MTRLPEKKHYSFSNFGFSTIIFSFVMICVISFSVLSLATANSDYKLSKKAAEKNAAFYNAEEQAYEHIKQVESLLINAFSDASAPDEYYNSLLPTLNSLNKGTFTYENGHYTYFFQEKISDTHTLDICLTIKYPLQGEDTFYEILEWKSVYKEQLPEDDFLDLMDN